MLKQWAKRVIFYPYSDFKYAFLTFKKRRFYRYVEKRALSKERLLLIEYKRWKPKDYKD
jgi:hypothetical protein